MDENTITVPEVVSKNKKSIPVNIDVSLRVELGKLQIGKFDKECFLLGSADTFISHKMCAENYAYNRFKKCLETIGLLDTNYTLYSFKHRSDVRNLGLDRHLRRFVLRIGMAASLRRRPI